MLGKALLIAATIALSSALQVVNLPGQPVAAFKQYSGYYSVGTNGNHKVHYWFMESQSSPSTDPVLLWLTGGPGCSGLSAILTEWGPFLVNDDGATLRPNPWGWNKKANVLTVEMPVGVGYSYAADGNNAASDDMTASDNWEVLKNFFTEFKQYAGNDFYVTGESYGGIYVPTLVQTILNRQSQFKINIKGFAIGNGMVNGDLDTDGLLQFEHKHGIIDEGTWNQVKSSCCQNDTDDCAFHNMNNNDFCGDFVNSAVIQAWTSGLNPYNLYEDCANFGGALPKRFALDYKRRVGKMPSPNEFGSVPCMNESAATTYLNRRDVRTALGIPGLLPAWSICNDDVNEKYVRQYNDMTPQVLNAVNAGLKVMLYYGDVDMACNFMMGQKFAYKLGLKQVAKKTEYVVAGQIAGYVTNYGQLKYVTVRGAGHLVPTDKPQVAYTILSNFINNSF